MTARWDELDIYGGLSLTDDFAELAGTYHVVVARKGGLDADLHLFVYRIGDHMSDTVHLHGCRLGRKTVELDKKIEWDGKYSH